MLAGSMGLGSWFGNVPSSSKNSGMISIGRPPKTAGTVYPAMPLPASTATFSGRMADRSTSDRRNAAYSGSRFRSVTRPGVPS